MTTSYKPLQRVLAIDPRRYGFGWAVLEGDDLLVDWGIRDQQTKRPERVLAHVAVLIDRYAPHAIVLEDIRHVRCRRRDRGRTLIRGISEMAPETDAVVTTVPMLHVREHFRALGATNKDAIARVIADRFPELDSFVPPRRKMWMPEHDRMSVFDAVALAIVAANTDAPSDDTRTVTSRLKRLLRRPRKSSPPIVTKATAT